MEIVERKRFMMIGYVEITVLMVIVGVLGAYIGYGEGESRGWHKGYQEGEASGLVLGVRVGAENILKKDEEKC